MEQFFDILQQVVSTGFGLWSIVLFLQVRKLKKAELKRDTVAVYQKIAESNNETLLNQNDKIILLEEKVSRLQIIIMRIEGCKYYSLCPARTIVQDYKRKYFNTPQRQPRLEQKGQRYPRDNPDIFSGDADQPGQPP